MTSSSKYTHITTTLVPNLSCLGSILVAGLLGVASLSSARADGEGRNSRYDQINLVSDQAGVALLQDTNLVNSWGISFSPTSPFWVSDNGTGLATLYAVTNDDSGSPHVQKLALEVTIPGDGNPTGQAFDGSGTFNGDIFLFVSEDGTVSGWHGALGTTAEILVSRPTAVYKGATLAATPGGLLLLAANFAEDTVDAYAFDTNLKLTKLVHQFTDDNAPAGYAPFNVQSLGGTIFVTFAKQDAAKHDDVAGPGNGLIDILDPQAGTFTRLVTGSDAGGKLRQINSPWGLAISPASFGSHGDQLLVGNFGSGTIMTFDADGKFRGLLEGRHEKPIVIDGLWALTFGNGGKAGVPDILYFSSGPNDEGDGLFGSLQVEAKPNPGNGHENNDEGN